MNFLHRFFNVYLGKLKFLSKKEPDFETFRVICTSVQQKAHINNKVVAESLLNLAKGMNNARLTTNKDLPLLSKIS